MAETEWPRRHKATNSWQYLSAREADSGARWTVIWDTKRNAESDARNTAVEKFEASALDRARHLLRMGFIVYEIRDPSAAVVLNEAGIRARLGLQPDPQEGTRKSLVDEEANNLPQDDLALAMVEAYGDRAASLARENARNAVTARQMAAARNWLRVADLIEQRRPKAS